MKLLNPIYDTVFKYLMEDLEIAKGFISTIIGCEISELYPAPQEATALLLKLKYNQLPINRMDYVAIINVMNEKGKEIFEKTVIEVQKSPFIPEIKRFRRYVGEKYVKQSSYKVGEKQVNKHLPIKTIYLLDKTFSKTLPAILHRKGEYYDVLYNKKYEGEKNKYVELLTHDSWFIQIQKLPPNLKSDLTKILSVFAPWMRDEKDERFINVEENELLDKKHALYHRILIRLQAATNDDKIFLAFQTEHDIEKSMEKNWRKAKIYKKQLVEERELKKQAEEKADAALQKIHNTIIKFHKKGFSIKQISEDLDMPEIEIQKIISSFKL